MTLEVFVDAIRRDAIITLLELPDPPELHGRGYRQTVEGRDSRFEEWWWLPSVATALQRADISEAFKRPATSTD